MAAAMALPMALPVLAQNQAADPAVHEPSVLSTVTITGSREQAPLMASPGSVTVISPETIRQTGPMHPQQILGQVPGAAVAVTNGEGHTTAIRQPFTTNPVYLYLEDGIPIRATGFFNHNALYETNIPQAGGIEVLKGPGSALYGSDAIGGIVNVLSRAPSTRTGASVSGEAGSFGWRRLLADGTTGVGDGAPQRLARLAVERDGGALRPAAGAGARGHHLDLEVVVVVGVHELEEEQRLLVVLRDLEGLSYHEIAAVTEQLGQEWAGANLASAPSLRRVASI